MLRVDIDGKTDYTVNSAGRLFKTVVEGSTSDRLMSTRSGVEPVTVNDKELLSGMYVMQDGSLPERGHRCPDSASKPYVTVSRHTAPQQFGVCPTYFVLFRITFCFKTCSKIVFLSLKDEGVTTFSLFCSPLSFLFFQYLSSPSKGLFSPLTLTCSLIL